jgi:hypothetical protein
MLYGRSIKFYKPHNSYSMAAKKKAKKVAKKAKKAAKKKA